MDTKGIDSLKEQLLREEEKLTAVAKNLRSQLLSLDGDIAKIHAAVSALDGVEVKCAGKRKLTKGGGEKSSLPAAGKVEVMKYMESVLQKGVVLTEKDLKEQVEGLAKKDGYTRLGIGLRIKEALSHERFARTQAGVRMSLLSSALQKEQGKVEREIIHT